MPRTKASPPSHRLFLGLALVSLVGGCTDGPDPIVVTGGTGEASDTDLEATGTSGDSTDSAGLDSTGVGSTSESDTASDTTTAGCMPGVFGASQFGAACFQ